MLFFRTANFWQLGSFSHLHFLFNTYQLTLLATAFVYPKIPGGARSGAPIKNVSLNTTTTNFVSALIFKDSFEQDYLSKNKKNFNTESTKNQQFMNFYSSLQSVLLKMTINISWKWEISTITTTLLEALFFSQFGTHFDDRSKMLTNHQIFPNKILLINYPTKK